MKPAATSASEIVKKASAAPCRGSMSVSELSNLTFAYIAKIIVIATNSNVSRKPKREISGIWLLFFAQWRKKRYGISDRTKNGLGSMPAR